MSRTPRFFTPEQIHKRIKSGRGQGMGKDYQPWLTIQDVPSRGVSHRIYSHKTQRVHHLLSNLELYVFFFFISNIPRGSPSLLIRSKIWQTSAT